MKNHHLGEYVFGFFSKHRKSKSKLPIQVSKHKYVLCSTLLGEMIPIWLSHIFQMGGSTTKVFRSNHVKGFEKITLKTPQEFTRQSCRWLPSLSSEVAKERGFCSSGLRKSSWKIPFFSWWVPSKKLDFPGAICESLIPECKSKGSWENRGDFSPKGVRSLSSPLSKHCVGGSLFLLLGSGAM